ncbi:MAG: phytoene desaturase family protein [Armatimonas sp.]
MADTKSAIVVGGGIGGLGAACLLAKKGYKVQLFEKNPNLGGVANTFSAEGFTFDMGPSWYLMPDVFENFFNLLGEHVEDHLTLRKLGPSYKIFFKDKDRAVELYSDLERDIPTLEAIEPGCGKALRTYLEKSKFQYDIALEGFVYKNYDTVFDFFNAQTMVQGSKLKVFQKMNKYVESYFSTDEVQKIMEYQLVFLGSSPYDTPALYNIMSHIDFNMGVYYPMGGIHEIPKALANIARKNGAELYPASPVSKILTRNGRAYGVRLASGEEHRADLVVCNANIRHAESLLEPTERQFDDAYWESRTLAPSAFILFLGVEGRCPTLTHHNLIFSQDWRANFAEIFDNPVWPTDPSLYVCAPSITDPTVAPEGCENLFVLVPMAPGMTATDEQLEAYAQKTLTTMEKVMDIPNLRERIKYQRIFWAKDFIENYNNYKGTALGLAHTLNQTAILRPNNISKKVKDLYFVGANTNPGIGMPICLISAELAYKRIAGDKSAGHLKSL